jgi:ABC-type dipeptide/oligopeptide/nickel transport system permease subunit
MDRGLRQMSCNDCLALEEVEYDIFIHLGIGMGCAFIAAGIGLMMGGVLGAVVGVVAGTGCETAAETFMDYAKAHHSNPNWKRALCQIDYGVCN